MTLPASAENEQVGEAFRLLQVGRHKEAARVCRSILDRDCTNAAALNLYGTACAYGQRITEAVDHMRKAIEHAPREPEFRNNLATLLLATGDHHTAREEFVRAAELSHGFRGDLRICRNSLLDEAKAATNRPYIHELSDITVDTAYWTAIDGDRIYSDELVRRKLANHPFVDGRTTADQEYVAIDLPEPVREVNEPCVFVGGDENYSHWLLHYLMRLALLEGRADLQALPLLVNANLKPYQRDSLAMLGYDKDRLIEVPRHRTIRCKQLYVPTLLHIDLPRMTLGIEWLRRRILPAVDLGPADTPTRLFISRRDASIRYLLNENEVVAALEPFDLQVIELEHLSFVDQIRLFARAELVIGPHGAGFTNLVFAPEDCRVVEIVSDTIAYMKDFVFVAKSIGQQLTRVLSKDIQIVADETFPKAQQDYRVNTAAVLDAVRAFILYDARPTAAPARP